MYLLYYYELGEQREKRLDALRNVSTGFGERRYIDANVNWLLSTPVLSSYLRAVSRGGVGWQVTGCARHKWGPVVGLAEGRAKDVVGCGGGGGGGDAGRACTHEVDGETVREVEGEAL